MTIEQFYTNIYDLTTAVVFIIGVCFGTWYFNKLIKV